MRVGKRIHGDIEPASSFQMLFMYLALRRCTDATSLVSSASCISNPPLTCQGCGSCLISFLFSYLSYSEGKRKILHQGFFFGGMTHWQVRSKCLSGLPSVQGS